MRRLSSLSAAALVCAGLASPALAQEATQPPVPAVTEGGESLDSGVGDLDAEAWVGKTVKSSDDREIGTVQSVRLAADTTDGGLLLVEREGRTYEIPLSGASLDGDTVTVTPLYDSIVTP